MLILAKMRNRNRQVSQNVSLETFMRIYAERVLINSEQFSQSRSGHMTQLLNEQGIGDGVIIHIREGLRTIESLTGWRYHYVGLQTELSAGR